jgi:predicted nucleic acid-binding protein
MKNQFFYLNEGIKNGVIRIVEVSYNEKEDIEYIIKTKLGIGEVSCMALCMKERKIFITDDRKAKKRAEKINIKTFDTIEFIKEFVKDEDLLKIIREKFKTAYPKRFEEL